MPEIEITDDQREYLESLRDELDRDVVYGHVRVSDALQYLIDSHEGDLSVPEGQHSSTPESEAREDDDGATEADVDGPDAEGDEEAADPGAETIEEPDDEGDDAEDDDAVDAESDESDDGATAAAAPTPGGGDGRLNAMMQLLDTHDDKWHEGDGDARYEVELPDGSTETAQTKDDVRALLFKNY